MSPRFVLIAAFAGSLGASPAPPPAAAPAGMVWVPGGEFSMGVSGATQEFCGFSEAGEADDAVPLHRVSVSGFWMDAAEVTNAQFARFVAATAYVTIAERPLPAEQFPDLKPEQRQPGSLVFSPPEAAVPLADYRGWWRFQTGASWRHPEGPASDWRGRENFPVVQIAYPDALAYAQWAHKRLPTEAEWEFASRGGVAGARYVWGNELTPHGRWMANIWQGHFPNQNTSLDGYAGLAPVRSFPANAYGLYDMAGNVWEWCSDWYRADYYATLAAAPLTRDPGGPATSADPAEPGVPKRVLRGGSFLCSDQYCSRYVAGARGKCEPLSAANHIGFRCVLDSSTPR